MLKPITKPGVKMAFSTYDLEWYPDTYKPRLIGLDDGDHYREFGHSVTAFLDEVLTPKYSGRVFFAHAGGLADVQFLLEVILKNPRGLAIEASFSGSSAIIVRITKEDNVWTFADSYWLLRDKLSKIGESIGLEKGGAEYTCPGVTVPAHEDEDRPMMSCGHRYGHCIFYAPFNILREYNAKDCRILHRAISRLEEELLELGGELKMTIAGSAMRLFRGAFLKQEIETSEKINAISREAYIASRVEVFRKTLKGPAGLFDFNSSFPYSLTKDMPGKCFAYNRKWKTNDLALVRASIVSPKDLEIPPIPYRYQNRVYFPTGGWTGWFSGVDLRFLLECGGIIEKIHEAYHFEPFDCLRGYVNELYERRRKETDSFRRLVYKYLLNSLYGKFGEMTQKEMLIVNKDVPKGAYNIVRVEGLPNAFFFERDAFLVHEHVPVSMVTTAYSRELLTRSLHDSEHDRCAPGPVWNGRVEDTKGYAAHQKVEQAYQAYEALRLTSRYDPFPAYCDTDSIPTQGWLGNSDVLGALKWEESIGEEEDSEYLCPKLYRFGAKVRAKGFSPREGKKKLVVEDFEVIAKGAHVSRDRMMRVKEVLRSQDYRPRGKIVDKHIALVERPKRCEFESGRTRPWSVKEIESPWKKAN